MYTSVGMIHSKKAVEEITVLEKTGDNKYIVLTEDGVKCEAILNYFVGLYYVDDIYSVIKETDEV